MRKIRIGINILYLIPGRAGGLETVLRNLLTSFRKIDDVNEYVLFTNREGAGKFDIGGSISEVACPVSATFRPGKILWEQAVFPWVLKKHGIDVLLSPGNVAPFCAPCPRVSVINDAIPFMRPESLGAVERTAMKLLFLLTARTSAAVITLSESARRELVQFLGVAPSRVHVVYLAAEERFRPTTENLDALLKRHGITRPYVLCVASSRPYKNVDGLVRAFAALKERNRVPHQLVVTGLSGRGHGNLLQAGETMLQKGQLVLTGFVSDSELPVLYSGATLSVYPSRYEGFGLPVLESMSCGTPVVSSNAASLPEVVGDAGLLFDPDDIEGMAGTIDSVLNNDDLLQELSRKGLEHARLFSWDRSAQAVLDLLVRHARRSDA